MTSDERAAMRARCQAATPRPWVAGPWIAPPWPWTPADLRNCLGEIERLESENARLREQVAGHVARIAAQSER